MIASRGGGRSAFTLVELLIAMVVIAVLAGVMLGALARASLSAKVIATRSRVHKLHSQVMTRWESYQTRRLPIDAGAAVAKSTVQAHLSTWNVPGTYNSSNARALAGARLLALRELMRLEMPQRYEDISANTGSYPGPAIVAVPAAGNTGLEVLDSTPALSLAYLRRYNSQANQPTAAFQGAECLYMIVTMGLEDTSLGTHQLSLADVGDVDGDGMPEFMDGWNRPISFLRWAPGFDSDLQPDADASTVIVDRDPVNRHDPFDPLRIDTDTTATAPRGFQLFPLIYSAGPDEVQDIWATNAGMNAAELNDPYHLPSAPAMQAGTPMTPTATQPGEGRHMDNVHNQLLATG